MFFLYSDNLSIVYGFPQRPISGPILFNVNVIELFVKEHHKSDFSNHADDTPCFWGHIFWNDIGPFVEHDITYLILTLTDFVAINLKKDTSKFHLFLSHFIDMYKHINIDSIVHVSIRILFFKGLNRNHLLSTIIIFLKSSDHKA